MGLFSDVYVGPVRPASISEEEIQRLVVKSIKEGAVSAEAVEMMNRASSTGRPCAFFPVWGSGAFLFSLIKASGNKSLIGTAERFLDHDMRLRHVFARAGLEPAAIDSHLKALETQRGRLLAGSRDDASPEYVWSARDRDSTGFKSALDRTDRGLPRAPNRP
jgi:hypothetical protein